MALIAAAPDLASAGKGKGGLIAIVVATLASEQTEAFAKEVLNYFTGRQSISSEAMTQYNEWVEQYEERMDALVPAEDELPITIVNDCQKAPSILVALTYKGADGKWVSHGWWEANRGKSFSPPQVHTSYPIIGLYATAGSLHWGSDDDGLQRNVSAANFLFAEGKTPPGFMPAINRVGFAQFVVSKSSSAIRLTCS